MRNVALAGLIALGACGDDGGGTVRDASVDSVPMDANPNLVQVALIPGTVSQDVDLLFVIDDSPSMLDKQTNLKNSFPSFLSVFGAAMPNVHIGVITTDMGSLGADDASPGPGIGSGPGMCSGTGKDGALQTFGSSLVTSGKYIIDENGTKNYTGSITAAFASIASAGANGCGFEQPLAAIRRAFENVANAGFVRASARLAIIVLSDEDDCSMAHSTILTSDPTMYGPLQSFRCTRFGVTCDVGGTTTDAMNELGAKSACHSNDSAALFTDLPRYKALLQSIKPNPRDVLFGAIVSPATSLAVEDRTPPGGGAAVRAAAHSCQYTGSVGEEVADPAVRLTQLATETARGAVVSVCSPNLAPAMLEMGQQVNMLLGVPCIGQAIAQPTTCQVFDLLAAGGELEIPACSDGGGSPCFTLVADAVTCPAAQNLKVQITRAFPAAADTYTSVRCTL
jgi:hypothetical protein